MNKFKAVFLLKTSEIAQISMNVTLNSTPINLIPKESTKDENIDENIPFDWCFDALRLDRKIKKQK